MRNLVFALVATALLAACTEPSNDLFPVYEPPVIPERIAPDSFENTGMNNPALDYTPQVDILFVIDNSLSMIQEIKRATDSINKFVDVFTAENQVDFHIGVMTVWDSVRYSTPTQQKEVDQFVKDATGNILNFSADGTKEITVQGKKYDVPKYLVAEEGQPLRNFWNKGELLPLKQYDDASGRFLRPESNQRFISNGDNADGNIAEKLKSLLSVDVVAYEYQKDAEGKEVECDLSGSDPSRACTEEQLKSIVPGTGRGPEVEEIFSPIKAALTNRGLIDGPNKGFFRKSAFKVVVILTDADDSSVNISSEELKFLLDNSTDREEGHKVAVYSIVPKTKNSCPIDYGLYDKTSRKYSLPVKLPQFQALFGNSGKSYEICSEFGEDLADIGQDVLKRTLALTEIKLERYPAITQETIRDNLELPGGLAAESQALFPELDCDEDLLKQTLGKMSEPLVDSETQEDRLAAVEEFVANNYPAPSVEVTNWGPNWLRVCYGKQRVPVYNASTDFGYTWDKDRNSIKIRGADKLAPLAAGRFVVHATELDLRRK